MKENRINNNVTHNNTRLLIRKYKNETSLIFLSSINRDTHIAAVVNVIIVLSKTLEDLCAESI
ncbi:MAG: hypothetical protein BWY04_00354 [candidate division CPR1 bacterium ADurb.Bin160]|uniref:Uncharacterized protein n=1 Tax=candidate division CPR1 bacterium ADurb.Bin160 TaxID=1852826 RepID=A0A1V5ZPY0_9BACT|nr:MAG: hypothetical protein BWY04_00354 [candidate division CPR1 bacterium ADurb.Bin160]